MSLKFSLVLATIERTKELERFLDSLNNQTYKNFELIIIDQNKDDRLKSILKNYAFSIKHLTSEKGLSKARNVGLKHVTGDVVAFPDDDCWYPNDLLFKLNQHFNSSPKVDGITGVARDENHQLSSNKWHKKNGTLCKKTVWNRAISFTVFLKSHTLKSVNQFDETLGVGAQTPWGSGEETDFLIRTLNKGLCISYKKELFVFHPSPVSAYNQKSNIRAKNYGMGFGKVLRKHQYSKLFVLRTLLRPILGILLSLCVINIPRAKFYYNVFIGRLIGYSSNT